MSIADLLIPSTSPIRRRTFCILEALTIHLILSCTWFCNGTFEPYRANNLPMNVDYNSFVIYEDPYNASLREPFTPDLDPHCLDVNQMSYLGLSNACFRSNILCSQLQSSRFMPEEHHSREAEATLKSSEIGSIFKGVIEELSESLKSDMINRDASRFPLPMLVNVKSHLLDWGNGYLLSRKLALLALTSRQKNTVLRVCKPTSRDNQFYVCNYSGSLLDKGGRVSICFTFLPKHLRLSSARLVSQASCGGSVIQGKGFAVSKPIEDEIIEMAKIPFSGWWSKSISVFSSISLTVYAMEFKSSICGIMRSLFKKILPRLSMKKIYAVTLFVMTLTFLRHCYMASSIMQRFSRTYLFLDGNSLMPTDGSAGSSKSMHRNQEVLGKSISHKVDVSQGLKKKSRSMVMDCSDTAKRSVVSQCAKLDHVIFSVDNISKENKKRESEASPVMKSAVVLNLENGDSANIGNIAVKVGKEKRKKKRGKGPRAGAAVSIDSPGSQSGYSTPPTPMSPVTTVLLPNRSSYYAKSEKHKNTRSPVQTMTNHFSEKSAFMGKSPTADDMKLPVPKKVLGDAPKQTSNEPVLGSSGNFPAIDYPAQYLYPRSLPPSAIAPHARAPGSKLCKISEKVALVKEEVDSDFTYNLWGDSFFGFDRIGRLKEPSVISLGNASDSFSFFAEGPVLMENFHPIYVSPFDPKGWRLERVVWSLACVIIYHICNCFSILFCSIITIREVTYSCIFVPLCS